MKVINENLSLNTKTFEIRGNKYEVTQSKVGADNSVFNTLDTIINRTNGNKKTLRRADLKIMIEKFNAKYLSD